MALVLTEEQSMLRDSARGLISDKAPVSHLRGLRDSRDATGFSRELWKSFAEMGFSGLLVPEEFGGSGLGCVEAGVVMEEIGRTLMPSPFLPWLRPPRCRAAAAQRKNRNICRGFRKAACWPRSRSMKVPSTARCRPS
jgi:alkylation response protein AidB-like acyl-CoA dehydrogenase